MKWCVLVLAFAGLTRGDNAIDTKISSCPDLNAQDEMDIDKITGKWYVVEVLEHMLTKLSSSYIVDSCPIVRLKQLEYQPNILRLLWTEESGNVEYSFVIHDLDRRKGLWRTMSIQNGTLAEKPTYRHFMGTVHVMKAVASDMVLTFCSRNPNNQFYSLLLSREHTLQDKRGVHNLLQRRGLNIYSIRETCVNGGVGSRRGMLDLVAWAALIGLLSSSVLFRSWQ